MSLCHITIMSHCYFGTLSNITISHCENVILSQWPIINCHIAKLKLFQNVKLSQWHIVKNHIVTVLHDKCHTVSVLHYNCVTLSKTTLSQCHIVKSHIVSELNYHYVTLSKWNIVTVSHCKNETGLNFLLSTRLYSQ